MADKLNNFSETKFSQEQCVISTVNKEVSQPSMSRVQPIPLQFSPLLTPLPDFLFLPLTPPSTPLSTPRK